MISDFDFTFSPFSSPLCEMCRVMGKRGARLQVSGGRWFRNGEILFESISNFRQFNNSYYPQMRNKIEVCCELKNVNSDNLNFWLIDDYFYIILSNLTKYQFYFYCIEVKMLNILLICKWFHQLWSFDNFHRIQSEDNVVWFKHSISLRGKLSIKPCTAILSIDLKRTCLSNRLETQSY